jgi:hypothetical protein
MLVGKIFHLEIYEEIFIDMLIKVLISLFVLKTLNISSLSLSHSEGFSDDNTKVLNFYINHNRITKVYLKKMNTIEDKMISSKKLLFDYTIKRIVDNIYLQWK